METRQVMTFQTDTISGKPDPTRVVDGNHTRKIEGVYHRGNQVKLLLRLNEENSSVGICHIVAANGYDQTTVEAYEQSPEPRHIVISRKDEVSHLRKPQDFEYDIIAYQRPIPGKFYAQLPETIIVGRYKRDNVPVMGCFTRTMLREAFGKRTVDAEIDKKVEKAGQLPIPKPSRQRRRKDENLKIKREPREQCDLDRKIKIPDPVKEEVEVEVEVEAEVKKEIVDHLPDIFPSVGSSLVGTEQGTRRASSTLESLPSEILDIILDYVLDPDLPSHAVNSCESIRTEEVPETRTPNFPGILTTSQILKEQTLDWFFNRTLTIRAKCWPFHPPRNFGDQKLPATLIRQARKVRLDLSGLSYFQLTKPHPVITQLVNIINGGHAWNSLTLFVPPHYESLPTIARNPQVETLLGPLVAAVESQTNIIWDPTDFDGETQPSLTPLTIAVLHGNEELVDFILKHPVQVDDDRLGELTALQIAIQQDNVGVVQRLLWTDKVDINRKDQISNTPVHVAVFENNERILRLLLHTGKADIRVQNVSGETPLKMAQVQGKATMVKLLRDAIANGQAFG